MSASFSNLETIGSFDRSRLSPRRLLFLPAKRIGRVHDRPIWERSGPRQANAPRRNSLSLSIILMNFVLFAWLPTTRAQSFDLGSYNHGQRHTISVRELRIPAKAKGDFRRGFECMSKGEARKCLRYFQRAIQEFPDYYEAYYDQALAQIALNDMDAALQSFQRAIDLSGGHFARAYFGYGLVLDKQGKAKDAEPIVRRGLQEDSTLSEGYAVLAAVLFDEGRLDEAEETARKALRMPDPSIRNALLALAFVHLKRQEYPLAAEDLENYLKAVRSGQFRENAEFVKYLENKLSDAKTKSSLNLQAHVER